VKLADVTDRDAWRAFAPSLHIGNEKLFAQTALPLGDNLREDIRAQLRHDGYFQEHGLDYGVDLAAMANTVRAISRAGIVPVFAYVFDEFWVPFHRLHGWYEALLGTYALMPDFWVWNLEPSRGDAGWLPHRDKNYQALLPDGMPKALTTWIPLSKAEPLNGCMYIVPASQDPVYGTARDVEFKFQFPAIRALPADPGDVLMWNQSVLHWGGRTSPRAKESRVSMAFEFQRGDVAPYNQPLLKPQTLIPFEARLKLIGMQILQYRHMYRFDSATEELAQKLVG
jgi:ectoine hydroxylase-related dioxygenase (phytanoyl-CoA dioxygenase family)